MLRRGIWYERTILPSTPGIDFVGNIIDCSKKIEDSGKFKKGDKVCALVQHGGNSRYIKIPVSQLIKVPDDLDDVEAVAMVSVYMTAYQSLHGTEHRNNKYNMVEGKSILVIDGMTAFGQATIQLARRARAGKIFTTAKSKHHSVLRNKNVEPLDLDPEKWLPHLKGSMDIVIDGFGADEFESSSKALKADSNAYLVCVGIDCSIQENPGFFGFSTAAAWNVMKVKYFMGQTFWYNAFNSFKANPEKYKVRNS